MKKIKDFYDTLSEHSFFVLTMLFLFNLFTFFAKDELKSAVDIFNQLLPNIIQNYLNGVEINPETIFGVYNLFLLFQLSALLYLWVSDWNIFYFPYEIEIKEMFEHSIFIAVIGILTSNLFARTDTLQIGIQDYFNYTLNQHTILGTICLGMYSLNCLFLLLLASGYFYSGKIDNTNS